MFSNVFKKISVITKSSTGHSALLDLKARLSLSGNELTLID